MNNEYKIYASFKYTVMIGVILFSITLFIGTTMLFFSNSSAIHTITGSMNIIFALFIAYITFQKINNRKPEIVFNELGIWLKGMEKLYPWALIDRIELNEFNSESEVLYKNYLQIKFNNEDKTLSVPFDDLDVSFEYIKDILKKFEKSFLID